MIVDCCFLLKHGVPWDQVFGRRDRPLTRVQRMAFVVAMGELEGGRYNWQTGSWEKPKS